MKPIFEEERQFLNKRLGVNLPKGCWKKHTKIYLDMTCKKPLYTFRVKDGNIELKKDNTELFQDYQQKTIDELIEINNNRLDELENKAINATIDYILNNQDQELYVISHSGGKDSVVLFNIWNKALDIIKEKYPEININWEINFSNTSNESADTYRFIKQKLPQNKLHILNPKIGYYQWITKVKNYFIPTVFARNCCSTYKEGQLNKHYDNNMNITMLTGVRKYESAKRAKYDYIMDYDFRKELFGNSNLPEKWTTLAPIVEWHNEDIWLYILRERLEFNPMYRKGFYRVGCLICPFQHDYIDLLIQEYYPKQWKRWMDILKKNYEVKDVENRLKWTFEEYADGRWKTGTGKIQELIQSKPTDERVKEVADLLGISEELAKKYFKRKCDKCDKKLNPTEVAMFLKLYGRYEGQVDDREYLCKKCVCKELDINTKEYNLKAKEFRDNGCNLF